MLIDEYDAVGQSTTDDISPFIIFEWLFEWVCTMWSEYNRPDNTTIMPAPHINYSALYEFEGR